VLALAAALHGGAAEGLASLYLSRRGLTCVGARLLAAALSRDAAAARRAWENPFLLLEGGPKSNRRAKPGPRLRPASAGSGGAGAGAEPRPPPRACCAQCCCCQPTAEAEAQRACCSRPTGEMEGQRTHETLKLVCALRRNL